MKSREERLEKELRRAERLFGEQIVTDDKTGRPIFFQRHPYFPIWFSSIVLVISILH